MVIIGNTARMCLPSRRRTSSTISSGSLTAIYPYAKGMTMAIVSTKRRKAVRYRDRTSIPYRYR